MNYIENILQLLKQPQDRPILREVRYGKLHEVRVFEFRTLVRSARSFIQKSGLKKGDRCGLLAPNSIRWAAVDLALSAEGIIVVPLYSRQAPNELVNMLKDNGASAVFCSDEALLQGIKDNWHLAANDAGNTPPPSLILFNELFKGVPSKEISDKPIKLEDSDCIRIIYTSGTSGEPKGVMLTVANITYMLGRTTSRLDQLMNPTEESPIEEVFHYLPFCFAGSWIILLSSLSRNAVMTLSMDLNKLADELKIAAPQYFLNVPTLLERIKNGVETQISQKPPFVQSIYNKGKAGWVKRFEKNAGLFDNLWFLLANHLILKTIRQKLGVQLKALICGSAPLSKDTQMFFMMMGIKVLQCYGLTETTALCTMDDPDNYMPGKVGPAIDGVEMKLGENDELLVRGPNIFAGYWNRPEATANTMLGDWFRTGDQGVIDENGFWSITGRLKNLIILNSGHNIAPEPIEEKILTHLPKAQQCVVMGNGSGYLAALITGDITDGEIESVLASVNPQLPHYKQIHKFHINKDALTIESGLLTANGKLKRDAIAAEFEGKLFDADAKAQRK